MKHLLLLLFTLSLSTTYAQYYTESLITEEDGLLMDEANRLYLDTASGMLLASHDKGISKIYGKDIKTISIPEYESEEIEYTFEVINDRLFFHHYEILEDDYHYEPLPFGHTLVQITVTDADRDTLEKKFEAYRDSKGNYWLNRKNDDESFEIIKISDGDTTILDLPFKHKIYFEAYFTDLYSIAKRSTIFTEDKKGNIWIVSEDDRLAKINIQTNEVELTSMKSENIFRIAYDKKGRLLISTYPTPQSESSILLFDEGKLVKRTEIEGLGYFYKGYDREVYVLGDKDQFHLVDDELVLMAKAFYFNDMMFDSSGNIYTWTFDEDYFNYIIKRSGSQVDTIYQSIEDVTRMVAGPSGILWLNSPNGIIKLQPSSVSKESYEFLDPDNPKNYYFSLQLESGWQFFNTTQMIAYHPEKGEKKEFDYMLFDYFKSTNGKFYCHMYDARSEGEVLNEKFIEFNQDGSFKTLEQTGLDPYDYLLNNDYYGAIHKNVFYLNSNQGAYENTGSGFKKYAVPFDTDDQLKIDLIPGFANFALFHLVRNLLDQENREVVDSRIFNYNTQQYEPIPWKKEGVNIDQLYKGKGDHFLGKVKGKDQIISFYKDQFTIVDIPKSSINDSIIKPLNRDLRWLSKPITDKEGNYYFMGGVNGLLCFYPQKAEFKQFTQKDGLVGNNLSHLFFDQDSTHLYLLSYEGIQSLRIDKLQEGKLSQVDFYSRSQGIQSITRHHWQNDTTLILHQEKGYLTLSLGKKKENSLSLILEGIEINSNKVNWSEYENKIVEAGLFSYPSNFELDYNENRIKFNFQAIDHFSTSSAQYYHQLVGVDRSFIKSAYGEATYQNLPSGDYNFEVYAIDKLGHKSNTISLSFKVLKPFYQEVWFIFLCNVALFVLFFGFYKWRVRALKRRQEVLEGMVKEKTIELEEEKNLALEQRDIIEEKNREITDSISYSKRLQDSILPPLEEISEALPDSFVCFLPKDIVSGDFYWFEEVDGTKFIACADCTGHGVPGAMVSLVCANALNRCVNEFKIYDPAKILDTARKLIIRTFQKSGTNVKDGMDISLCAIKGNKLTYAGAFNPVLVIRDKDKPIPKFEKARALEENDELQIFEVKADKQPVGLMDEMSEFEQHEFEVYEGDTFYLFSDGIVDQFGGGSGKKLKAPNFRKILLSFQSMSMQEQKEKIESEFNKWKGNLEQIDDVCVIGVRV